jgi:hypothetical protein
MHQKKGTVSQNIILLKDLLDEVIVFCFVYFISKRNLSSKGQHKGQNRIAHTLDRIVQGVI